MSSWAHLARRFFGSLRPTGPSAGDESWARERLLPGEVVLWGRMGNADRRHAVGVARRVDASLGAEATRPVLAAALLHDVGKVESGLGTFGRVVATLTGRVAGREVASRRERIGRYLRHPEIGAELLEAAGGDPLTVAWAREHHVPASPPTVPPELAAALRAADDD